MFQGRRVVAIIPARGGSKGIPDKNIIRFAGQPLISWTIELAKRTEEIDRVIVSTDCDEIAKISKDYGAEVYMRLDHLASDTALVIDVLRDLKRTLCKEGEKAEIMLLLECTAPMRNREDVVRSIELLVNESFDSVATFQESATNPHRAWKIDRDQPKTFIEGAVPWLPRQKLPKAYELNGYVYAFKMDKLPDEDVTLLFGRYGAVIVPCERAYGDIDTITDIEFQEKIFLRRG